MDEKKAVFWPNFQKYVIPMKNEVFSNGFLPFTHIAYDVVD